MPTSDSTTHAAQAREDLRSLAHTSRHISDPGEIYDLLGDLSLAINSLAQSLHQIAKVHDDLAPSRLRVGESARSGRATSFAVSWEVHRAAEMLKQVSVTIDHARQDEGRISYAQPDPLITGTPQSSLTPTINGLHR